mgnify:CR=1 FL=1
MPRRRSSIRQHLIDPEICIRCNTCEETCPVDAITHDARNYVVDADVMQQLSSPASRRARPARSTTGASCPKRSAYRDRRAARRGTRCRPSQPTGAATARAGAARRRGAAAVSLPSRRASADSARRDDPHAAVGRAAVRSNLHTRSASRRSATVVGNFRVTGRRRRERYAPHRARLRHARRSRCSRASRSASCRRASTRAGRPHHRTPVLASRARATASAPGYNNVALTVKRVTERSRRRSGRGVCSNYLCDLQRRATPCR